MLAAEFNKRGLEAKRGFVWLSQSDVIGLTGIHVECKFCNNLTVRTALAQADREAEKRKDGEPCVFWKKPYEDWTVTMHLDFWTEMYKAWLEKEENHGKQIRTDEDIRRSEDH